MNFRKRLLVFSCRPTTIGTQTQPTTHRCHCGVLAPGTMALLLALIVLLQQFQVAAAQTEPIIGFIPSQCNPSVVVYGHRLHAEDLETAGIIHECVAYVEVHYKNLTCADVNRFVNPLDYIKNIPYIGSLIMLHPKIATVNVIIEIGGAAVGGKPPEDAVWTIIKDIGIGQFARQLSSRFTDN